MLPSRKVDVFFFVNGNCTGNLIIQIMQMVLKIFYFKKLVETADNQINPLMVKSLILQKCH